MNIGDRFKSRPIETTLYSIVVISGLMIFFGVLSELLYAFSGLDYRVCYNCAQFGMLNLMLVALFLMIVLIGKYWSESK